MRIDGLPIQKAPDHPRHTEHLLEPRLLTRPADSCLLVRRPVRYPKMLPRQGQHDTPRPRKVPRDPGFTVNSEPGRHRLVPLV